MNNADDATWLPEGAYVVLGACQVGGCDRVGWAIPTYGTVVINFVAPNGINGAPIEPLKPHTMEGVLRHIDWWCPVHGSGRHDNIAQRWAQSVMDDIQAWAKNPKDPQWPEGHDLPRFKHEDQDILYRPGLGPAKFSMAIRRSK